MRKTVKENPYRPGAGHFPPHLAGRELEIQRCKKLFEQKVILRNVILTGLRGVGKTALLTRLKQLAVQMEWLWCGTDMSESTSVTEESLATRLLADVGVVTATIPLGKARTHQGFGSSEQDEYLTYDALTNLYQKTPGLVADKLKATLQRVRGVINKKTKYRGIIFAYDEVQTMTDHTPAQQYPLSLLLDVFQSLQRMDVPFMLILTGLPTLLPKLVQTRTYTERMFETLMLDKLSEQASKEAILKPLIKCNSPIGFTPPSVNLIVAHSGGYPYFIQFICREVFDVFMLQMERGAKKQSVPIPEILKKLDSDFFLGRWEGLSEREKELVHIIAFLKTSREQFTAQEIIASAKKKLKKPFGSSQTTQMLNRLQEKGIVYRNRHGRYSFAVPLFNEFVKRQS